MDIPKELRNDIYMYCNTNKITDYDAFILKCIKQGFTVEKYGSAPAFKEKIVEKIVEVPVEKIVEKIVEVPAALDTDMSEKYKQYLDELTKFREESLTLLNANETLKAQLAEMKKKKDIYGE
jgi:Inner membrane complex protein